MPGCLSLLHEGFMSVPFWADGDEYSTPQNPGNVHEQTRTVPTISFFVLTLLAVQE